MKDLANLKGIKIAHRGLFNNKDVPENSIAAFKAALDKNIPIELDVRLTKDKKVVVFHDRSLKRLTTSSELIKDLDYNDIKKYPLLKTKEIIPTLKEVLDLVDGKVLLDIEIKTEEDMVELIETLIKTLQKYSGLYVLKSFNPKVVRYIKKKYSQIKCGLLISDNYDKKIYEYLMISKLIMLYSKPDFLAVSKNIVDTKKIQKFRKNHPVLVWTIENIQELIKYKSKADSYICNNLPY